MCDGFSLNWLSWFGYEYEYDYMWVWFEYRNGECEAKITMSQKYLLVIVKTFQFISPSFFMHTHTNIYLYWNNMWCFHELQMPYHQSNMNFSQFTMHVWVRKKPLEMIENGASLLAFQPKPGVAESNASHCTNANKHWYIETVSGNYTPYNVNWMP